MFITLIPLSLSSLAVCDTEKKEKLFVMNKFSCIVPMTKNIFMTDEKLFSRMSKAARRRRLGEFSRNENFQFPRFSQGSESFWFQAEEKPRDKMEENIFHKMLNEVEVTHSRAKRLCWREKWNKKWTFIICYVLLAVLLLLFITTLENNCAH